MASFKCKNNERFPASVEKQNWKFILNALGERMGNARGVGNDAVITQVKVYDAVRVEAEFRSTVVSYNDETEKGQSRFATNNYHSFSDIPYEEIVRNRRIMLGGTLATHICNSCFGMGSVNCPACGGSGHNMLNGNMNHCTKCNGSGRVSCENCGGTGHYQTYRTLTLTDKVDDYLYCPVEALEAMIKKQKIPTDVLYEGSCLKMNSLEEIKYNDMEKLYAKIEERLGTSVKDDFHQDFVKEYNDVKETENNILDEITVHAECSPIIEIDYQYRKKEYSLYISKQTPAVYCYSKFPGRLSQRIRNLFSSDRKTDSKQVDSYGSKYQK